jgi:plasmid stabilization system protein ParE
LTLPLRISEEAEAEMAEAASWYEAHRSGLGVDFVEALNEAGARIVEMPRMGSPVSGVADEAIRRRAVRRFPYHVIYLELSDRLQVLAVAHDHRRPGYWAGRVRR